MSNEQEHTLDKDINMTVSPVCTKDGKHYAFVLFSKGGKSAGSEISAEGKIPDCRIISNNGFSEDELRKLEEYMVQELPMLKEMSAGIDVMRALMR